MNPELKQLRDQMSMLKFHLGEIANDCRQIEKRLIEQYLGAQEVIIKQGYKTEYPYNFGFEDLNMVKVLRVGQHEVYVENPKNDFEVWIPYEYLDFSDIEALKKLKEELGIEND